MPNVPEKISCKILGRGVNDNLFRLQRKHFHHGSRPCWQSNELMGAIDPCNKAKRPWRNVCPGHTTEVECDKNIVIITQRWNHPSGIAGAGYLSCEMPRQSRCHCHEKILGANLNSNGRAWSTHIFLSHYQVVVFLVSDGKLSSISLWPTACQSPNMEFTALPRLMTHTILKLLCYQFHHSHYLLVGKKHPPLPWADLGTRLIGLMCICSSCVLGTGPQRKYSSDIVSHSCLFWDTKGWLQADDLRRAPRLKLILNCECSPWET